ncbi:DTW domain-containing protein [Shewanella sp. A25]|nr:DTW domain-containing protein [Shewanella shenzhenensis]
MTRQYCPTCHYPLTACLCASVQPIYPKTRLYVLQHPTEVEHKKNSVRVLSLVVPDTQVFVGETEDDFDVLKVELERSGKPIYLVYPSEASIDIEVQPMDADCILLLLDGTWRKAFKMFQLNPWLAKYPAVRLGEHYGSRYKIRKSSRSDSLSTLEASAFMLSALDGQLKIEPLLNAFDAMVEMRISAMPAEVQLRYPQNE